MSKYEGIDFYNLDQHLTEEELMVRDLVRDWVDEEVLPIIEDYYTKGTFPREPIRTHKGNDHECLNQYYYPT